MKILEGVVLVLLVERLASREGRMVKRLVSSKVVLVKKTA